MSETETRKLRFPTGFFSTPERIRARFNSVYQVENIARFASKVDVTKEDFERYAAQFPDEGAKIKKMHDFSTFSGIGTASGFVGSTILMMRMTKTVPLILTGVFVSTVSAHFIADDIGSWIYGTYKFDKATANERFHEWVYMTKNEQSTAS